MIYSCDCTSSVPLPRSRQVRRMWWWMAVPPVSDLHGRESLWIGSQRGTSSPKKPVTFFSLSMVRLVDEIR